MGQTLQGQAPDGTYVPLFVDNTGKLMTSGGSGGSSTSSGNKSNDVALTQLPMSSAWAFPDNAINAVTDIKANFFSVLKPIWYEVNTAGTGALVLRNNSTFGTNFFYTAANAKIVRQNSAVQYVNVSCGDTTQMNALCSDPAKRATAIATLIAFCQSELFEGVELDFEDFGQWDNVAGSYANYKTFVTELGTALHAASLKLMIDCPPIWNNSVTVTTNEWTNRNSQGYYDFKYEDFESLPVDYLVPMAYDYEYDMSSGTPNQPLEWLDDILTWVKSKITDVSRIVVGLPSAGYSGATAGYAITGRTFTFLAAQTGFSAASRDASSAEIIWANGGISYAAIDDYAMNVKIARCMANGIYSYSLWHIGDNRYGTMPLNQNNSYVDLTSAQTITGAKQFNGNVGFYGTGPVAKPAATTDLGTVLSALGLRTAGTAYTFTTTGAVSFGSAAVTSLRTAFSARTTGYTILVTDNTVTGDTTSAAFNIQLPTAVGFAGREHTIKRINAGANNLTVTTTSSQTIDGATTYVLSAQWKYVTVKSDGANWIIVANN